MFELRDLIHLQLPRSLCIRLTDSAGEVTVVSEHNLLGGVCDCCRKLDKDDEYEKWELIDLKGDFTVLDSGTDSPIRLMETHLKDVE